MEHDEVRKNLQAEIQKNQHITIELEDTKKVPFSYIIGFTFQQLEKVEGDLKEVHNVTIDSVIFLFFSD